MRTIFTIILSLFILAADAQSDSPEYGLFFRAHNYDGNSRTTLELDNGQPFTINKTLDLSFDVFVRSNEPIFGSVVHLRTASSQNIHFSIATDDEKRRPTLIFDEGMYFMDREAVVDRWIPVEIHLNMRKNVVEVSYDSTQIAATFPLKDGNTIRISFGEMLTYLPEVAPMIIKDIKVSIDGKPIRHWILNRHDGSICYDELAKAPAKAVNEEWIIDNHYEWKQVWHENISGNVSVVYNPNKNEFYLVSPKEIRVLDANGAIEDTVRIAGGYPAMNYPSHMVFDPIADKIVSYSLTSGKASSFDFGTRTWSATEENTAEPHFYNHAKAFNPADSSFYFLGGYGFYKYHNELFRMKSGSGVIEKVNYSKPISPRGAAAMAAVGDKLYIFGGWGNKYGKQELSTYHYSDLHQIDLKTGKARTIWQRRQPQRNERFYMASTMYFNPSDSSFYAMSMANDGVMWKVSQTDTICPEVTKAADNGVPFQDCDFNLFSSPENNRMYAVFDKIKPDRTHDIAIYSLSTPLLDQAGIRQTPPESAGSKSGYKIWIIISLFIIAAGASFVYFRRKNLKKAAPASSPVNTDEKAASVENHEAQDTENDTDGEKELLPISPAEPTVKYYTRKKAVINLLESFRTYDKEGNDITAEFTPRLKHFLILLILYTEKNPQGLLIPKATELLWPDRDENSARNNRNVTLRKLRVLLQRIGNVEVSNENNFLRIIWSDDVLCDYHEVNRCIAEFKDHPDDSELLGRILELLLKGPLLPNTLVDWLDTFKGNYSSRSIDWLQHLLEIFVKRGDQAMILRIADIIFLHDFLNEDALIAKCSVLSAQGKKGIARNIYDRFCRDYRESMGEEYKTAFHDLERN